MVSQDFVVGNVVGMDFLVVGKTSVMSVSFEDSVVGMDIACCRNDFFDNDFSS